MRYGLVVGHDLFFDFGDFVRQNAVCDYLYAASFGSGPLLQQGIVPIPQPSASISPAIHSSTIAMNSGSPSIGMPRAQALATTLRRLIFVMSSRGPPAPVESPLTR